MAYGVHLVIPLYNALCVCVVPLSFSLLDVQRDFHFTHDPSMVILMVRCMCRVEQMVREAEESRCKEEEARLMAEQQRLREEAERLQQEKEAQEKARAEQEENERLQRQVRAISLSHGTEASKFWTCFC